VRQPWKRILALIIVATLLAGAAGGCRRGPDEEPASPSPTEAPGAETAGSGPTDIPSAPRGSDTDYPPAAGAGDDGGIWPLPTEPLHPDPWQPVTGAASVPPYQVASDLSNVVNLDQFGRFTVTQVRRLADDGFCLSPTVEEQLFYIYENNEYLSIPSFVTTDSVLQVYHLFFDYTLRQVEVSRLYPLACRFNRLMLEMQLEAGRNVADPVVAAAAYKNAAYFAVAARLLEEGERLCPPAAGAGSADVADRPAVAAGDGEADEVLTDAGGDIPLPTAVQDLVTAELELIRARDGRHDSAVMPFQLDYTQFIPRGHYTRSTALHRYFLGLMWYGTVPFPFYLESSPEPRPATEQIIQSCLITLALQGKLPGAASDTGGTAFDLWERLYGTTRLYVGASDDLSVHDYAGLLRVALGADVDPESLADEATIAAILEAAADLPGPRIRTALAGIPGGIQFRVMGQRCIPDSEALQTLTHWPERPFPRGLDVMASLGSDRAETHLLQLYGEAERWPLYPQRLKEMQQEFASRPREAWGDNLYTGWLWTLQALLQEHGPGYPGFMQSTAWQDKGLLTSLASWAEMRHDTLLYGKPSGAECGGDEPPPSIRGYVEPNPDLYSRLLWLTDYMHAELYNRGLCPSLLEERFGQFRDLLAFCYRAATKELAGEPLSDEEYEQIQFFGSALERLTLSVADSVGDHPVRWFEITSEADRNMALIADVHTSAGKCLEVGVGPATAIFVIVPIEGRLYLTRGAVFSYYEFTWAAADRLTDEKWQRMVQQGQAPAPPQWVQDLLTEPKDELPLPREPYNSGC